MIEAHKEGKFSWEKEIESLRQQLAESQAREAVLRYALDHYLHGGSNYSKVAREALSQPSDDSALKAMIEKAGEVMRERCRKVAFDMAYADSMAVDVSQTIRALPGVKMEDLK